MFFTLDRNGCMISYDDVKPGSTDDGLIIECDHFAPNTMYKPKWDYVTNDWIEGADVAEIKETIAQSTAIVNDATQSNETATVNAKLDLILELLQKKEE
ncbi:hypothetical protein NE293_02370 [Latilactobacillus curvatus]|uniref:hypothetical protein n=1 Tax=Latilactobacillus curvatus TaxID=28038 RepID=UPI002072FF7A|nr:hypothetical protein [Latilactobacillus curvatus]MCM6843525.1 hypothetical protein [Latilactobacillus curvatus]MCM6861595.1 hypothetical protein [Latilactobacillus curvatus]MCM6868894.1 hypothetical protein [Latilactobacillus curvatus]